MLVTPSRLVIKLGTGLLTTPRGNALDNAQFRRLTAEIAALVRAGHECLIVTSGAVGAGMVVLKHKERSRDLPTIQACAAIGQSRLMRVYETHFARHGLAVAQILLTHRDLDSRISASTMPHGTAIAMVTTVSATVMPTPCNSAGQFCQTTDQSSFTSGRAVPGGDTAGPPPM